MGLFNKDEQYPFIGLPPPPPPTQRVRTMMTLIQQIEKWEGSDLEAKFWLMISDKAKEYATEPINGEK